MTKAYANPVHDDYHMLTAHPTTASIDDGAQRSRTWAGDFSFTIKGVGGKMSASQTQTTIDIASAKSPLTDKPLVTLSGCRMQRADRGSLVVCGVAEDADGVGIAVFCHRTAPMVPPTPSSFICRQ